MAFTFEYISEGSDVENTPEHKKAVEMSRLPILGRRAVDPDRGAIFYCLSVGGGRRVLFLVVTCCSTRAGRSRSKR